MKHRSGFEMNMLVGNAYVKEGRIYQFPFAFVSERTQFRVRLSNHSQKDVAILLTVEDEPALVVDRNSKQTPLLLLPAQTSITLAGKTSVNAEHLALRNHFITNDMFGMLAALVLRAETFEADLSKLMERIRHPASSVCKVRHRNMMGLPMPPTQTYRRVDDNTYEEDSRMFDESLCFLKLFYGPYEIFSKVAGFAEDEEDVQYPIDLPLND